VISCRKGGSGCSTEKNTQMSGLPFKQTKEVVLSGTVTEKGGGGGGAHVCGGGTLSCG